MMPAKDLYHDAVKAALIKDGWIILADPYRIQYKDVDLYADLAAERPIAAEREGQKIVVEIKSFVGRSPMTDFQNAVGQYAVYRSLIQATEPTYQLYLAIDDITYENFFKREGIAFIIRTSQIFLLVVNIDLQEIVQWIS
jgi:CRISPR/Cas system-associated exonuclease Cas4 (RecB family)